MKTCEFCKRDISDSPYVIKYWEAIDSREYYHPYCYKLTHEPDPPFKDEDFKNLVMRHLDMYNEIFK